MLDNSILDASNVRMTSTLVLLNINSNILGNCGLKYHTLLCVCMHACMHACIHRESLVTPVLKIGVILTCNKWLGFCPHTTSKHYNFA